MQLNYRKLFSSIRRISAINATMRRGSQKGKGRDQEAGALALSGDLFLTHDDDHEHCLTLSRLTGISGKPLNIRISELHGSADTLLETAVVTQSNTDSDSDSDYYTDSGSTVLDSHSYLTAQEAISVKTLSMDPLSDPATQTSSPPPSVAKDQHDAGSPAHSPADDVEASDHEIHNALNDADVEETASDAALEAAEPIPSEYDTKDDALLSSPPPVHVQPDIPDPFLIDDDEDSEDETGSADERMAQSTTPSSAAADDEIALAQSTILEPEPDPATPTQPTYPTSVSNIVAPAPVTSPFPHPALFSPQPNVLKEVPAVPSAPSSEDEEDEEPPELYLPGLVLPTMFLPIPNTDPLTTLLTKFIPPEKRPSRDLSGEWQRTDFHTLVMTNSWRSLARMARDRIVSANPEDLPLILSLWYLRLASLARMRLFNQTSAECTNLFTVLNGVEPASARAWLFARVLPFELEVLHAKTLYWAGDHMGYLDALALLLARCKAQAKNASRKHDPSGVAMWKERGARMCLIIASQLIEMKDYTAAARLLEPLCKQDDDVSSPHLRSAVARIYLQGGHIAMAIKHFTAIVEDPTVEPSLKAMNAALLASAEGDWDRATNALRQIIQNDPDNYVAVNNLAVALLSQGHLKEGIQIMEDALRASPSTIVVAEPFLFNLSTLYELRSRTAADKKRELLVEVAKWAGDGLRIACLKMPTT